MSRPSKTGGGPGTNQCRVSGQSECQPKTVRGYPADQVIKRGQCVWLRAGWASFDDIWCLERRQLAPELRELSGLQPCITRLGVVLQHRAAMDGPRFRQGCMPGRRCPYASGAARVGGHRPRHGGTPRGDIVHAGGPAVSCNGRSTTQMGGYVRSLPAGCPGTS